MITITISYIALVARDDKKPGARVAFPQAKHQLEIDSAKQGRLKSGKRITLQTKRNGAIVTPETKGLPMGGRVMSISAAEGKGNGTYRLKETDELLKGDVQTVLQLYGGTFAAAEPGTASRYKDKEWKIGFDERQLTDTVVWTAGDTEESANDEYELIIDGKSTKIEKGDRLVFSNKDSGKHEFKDNGHGKVEIDDAEELYKLVDPEPNLKAKPEHPVLAQEASGGASGKASAEPQKVPGAPPLGGDLPLCPVGEP